MYTSLHDPDIVNKSYNEYLKLIKYYQGVKTKGLYVKYFNIDIFNSSYDDQLKNTYDRFTSSDIKYNLFGVGLVFVLVFFTSVIVICLVSLGNTSWLLPFTSTWIVLADCGTASNAFFTDALSNCAPSNNLKSSAN